MTKSDRDWQAEDDFRTLVSAQEVSSNKGRHKRARTAGRRLVRKETRTLGLKRKMLSDRSR